MSTEDKAMATFWILGCKTGAKQNLWLFSDWIHLS